MPNNEEANEEGGSGPHRETSRVRVCQWVTTEEGDLLEVSVFIVDRETQTVEHITTVKREGEEAGQDAGGAYEVLENEAEETLRHPEFRVKWHIPNAEGFGECPWCKPWDTFDHREAAERN